MVWLNKKSARFRGKAYESHEKTSVLARSTKHLSLKEGLILVIVDCVAKATRGVLKSSGGSSDCFHRVLHERRFGVVIVVLGVLGRHCRETSSSREIFLRTGLPLFLEEAFIC